MSSWVQYIYNIWKKSRRTITLVAMDFMAWNIDFSLRTKTWKQFVKQEMLRWGQCFCFTITKKQFLKLNVTSNVEDFDKIRKNDVTLRRDNIIFKMIIALILNEFCS